MSTNWSAVVTGSTPDKGVPVNCAMAPVGGGTVTVTYPVINSVSFPPALPTLRDTAKVQTSPGAPVQVYVIVCGPLDRAAPSLTLPLPVPPVSLKSHVQLVGAFVDW